MTLKLLCCDGGGIRGLITALLIQDLDQRYGIVAKADGLAGTSTGGLLALGLSHGVGIDTIVDIYRHDGAKIFKPNGWLLEERPAPRAAPRSAAELESGPGIFSCQYTNTGLQAIADKLFGNTLLSDTGKRLVAVNSARLWDGASWEPETLSNLSGNPYRNVRMADAALATSAAPTYFPPHAIGSFGYFADGGTFANNPSMTAVSEALAGGIAAIADLRVLSLGTGDSPQGIPPSAIPKPLDWGVTHWMWPTASGHVPATALLNLALDCTASEPARQASQMLGAHYCRANFRLSEPVPLDAWKDVEKLEAMTTKYMASPAWQTVREWVQQQW